MYLYTKKKGEWEQFNVRLLKEEKICSERLERQIHRKLKRGNATGKTTKEKLNTVQTAKKKVA